MSCARALRATVVSSAALLVAVLCVVPVASASGAPTHVPGQLIVTFAAGTEATDRSAAHRAAGATVVDRIPQVRADVVRVGDEEAALRSYRRRASVEVVERDAVRAALHDDCPASGCGAGDPFFAREYGLQNDTWTTQPPDTTAAHDADIDAVHAWLASRGTGVDIAILDSGIDRDHEDLRSGAKVVKDVNFSSSKSVEDKYGHGTHVAGTASAITGNGVGVSGVAPGARLMNVKVLSDNGFGSCSAIAKGMTWSADNEAEVLNLSLGGGACTAEQNAASYAWGKGAVIVAAAGNSNAGSVSCPACYPEVMAVAATDNADLKASFSNYGSQIDIAAPGVKVYSTFPNHRNRIGKRNYDYGSGTSMAAPHVAGAAALVWGPASGTNAGARARLESYADATPQNDAYWSAGRLNACRAVYGADAPPACLPAG